MNLSRSLVALLLALLLLTFGVCASAPAAATSDPGAEPTEPVEETVYPLEVPHPAYVKGFNDGSFGPKKTLTRAQMAQLLYMLGDYAPGPARFSDVPDSAWYAEAVNALAAAGILNGTTATTFSPAKDATRAALVAVLARISGETAAAPADFADVPEGFWAADGIALAQERRWVTGYPDGSFRPNQSIRRAEAIAILNRFLGRTPDREALAAAAELPFFPDVLQSDWFYWDVMEASAAHTARYETADSPEAGADYTVGTPKLTDGFYCFRGHLFVCENGAFVRESRTGTVNGISYVCAGKSGYCTADADAAATWNGNLVLLRGGQPVATPGEYETGFHVLHGKIYAAYQGNLIHTKCTKTLYGVPFTCAGANGECTVDRETLRDHAGMLVLLENSKPVADPGSYETGFHVLHGKIYAAYQGNLICTERTGTLYGVPFACAGASGECTVDRETLRDHADRLVLLKDGKPVADPGSYENGFYLLRGKLYAAYQGNLICTEHTGTLGGVPFTCTGASGECTVDRETLKDHAGRLVLLKDGKPVADPGSYENGFYVLHGKIYAAYQGNLICTEHTGTLGGVPFTCAGASGECTVDRETLKDHAGRLVLLENGKPVADPGSYENGFYLLRGKLYAAYQGNLICTEHTGTLGGVPFTCAGPGGECTVNARILRLWDGRKILIDAAGKAVTEPGLKEIAKGMYCVKADGTVLISGTYQTLYFGSDGRYTSGNTVIDHYIDAVVASATVNCTTQEEKLRAVYDYVFDHVRYLGAGAHVPRGADASTWTEDYMLMLINQDGRGLCYCYAAYMYYLCRRIGYNPTAISGGYGTKNADHGWIEIKFGGVPYIFDPEICSVRHKTQPEIYQRYTLYKAAYGSTPFPYHK